MGLRDDLLGLGMGAIGAVGEVLSDLAKAEPKGKLVPAEDAKNESDAGASGSNAAEDGAAGNAVPTVPAKDDPKTLFWDPYAIVEQLGYKERPTSVTYATINAMVWKMPILQSIIQTRTRQIASFAVPQHDRYKMGYRVKLRDKDKEPSKGELEWIKNFEGFLQTTGVSDNPNGRDNFEVFLQKLARDSLTYDQACFELVPDRRGLPCEWYAVDATTIRLADSASTYLDENLKDVTRYVQIYDGMVVNEYTQSELAFGVRNPRTDLRLFGYGVGEVEMLVTTITALLYAWEYNKKFFSQGTSAKGIINFKGAVPETQLQAFRRMWYLMISGTENAFKTPVVNSDELQYINLQQTNREMEYGQWMDFLIKVTCSMFSMDPVEVNFIYGNAGQTSALGQQSNKEKIVESKERGLRPLLRFIETMINKHILWPINESFIFEFVGLDALTQDQLADLNQKRVKTSMTVDEIRAEDDLEPLPDGKGEVILDPTWLQFSQGIDNPEAMGGGEFGEDGEGEDGEDFESMLAGMEKDDNGGKDDKDQDQGKPKGNKPPFGKAPKEDKGEDTEKSLQNDSSNLMWTVTL